MYRKIQILFLFIFLVINGCISKFVPEVSAEKQLLVVQGLLTDQSEPDTIKLSKSLPLGIISDAIPASGYSVAITDDLGSNATLSEIKPGVYVTPQGFRGAVGRIYTLHIAKNNIHYESWPTEMTPVPPIDSVYYEKTVIEAAYENFSGVDGCQIYLNTHDPANECRFFRWDFMETWVLRLLFPVENMTCWVSEKSHKINIKNTTPLGVSRIDRYPIQYITNETDRLKMKYSILVNQYSLTEDEYIYWEKIQNIAVQVGGLYDMIPATIPGNLQCIEIPDEQVLGYFSVSAKSSKRIFIKAEFEGIINQYPNCPSDTTNYVDPPGLGTSVWILDDEPYTIPPYKILTKIKGCADCTTRGTTVKPDYWEDK
jgi:hypothetical protein